MCDSCDETDGAPRPRVVPSEELIAAARAIEDTLPGEKVPAEAWPIFLGRVSGAVLWPHMERMMRAMDAAGVLCGFGRPLSIG
jgi:hypothetical protein